MLKIMRHHAKYFYVLFIIVILSFILWGVGTVDKGEKANIAAEVGKYTISADEYWRAYENANRFYKDIYKEKYDEEMQKQLKLKDKILDSLIGNRVLLTAAKDNGITVSNEELNDAIINEPAFMQNGVFNPEVYKNRLRLERLTPEAFENMRRQELEIQKIKRLIELSAETDLTALSNVQKDEQTLNALRNAMTNDAKGKAVQSFIDGYKKGIAIKIYKDRIS